MTMIMAMVMMVTMILANGDGDDGDDDIGDGDALNGSYWREVSPPENGRRGTHGFVAQQPNNTLYTTHNPTTHPL